MADGVNRPAVSDDGRAPAAAPTAIRTGRVARTTPLLSMGARTGLGRVGVLLRPGTTETRRRNAFEFHAKTAERYVSLLGGMKGALMKVGQLLSFVEAAGLVPEEYGPLYQQALSSLQADAPPMEYAAVSAVLEAELEAPPEELFDRFSPYPIAAASIGQVHAARRGDRELAVKVQYPGVADAIAADLANTDLLASLIGFGAKALPGFSTKVDIRAVVEEIRDRVGEELDYEVEASNQAEFAALYRDHPFARVPQVFPELSTRRVLTMEMVDGRRFKAACESDQALRDRWGEAILRFVYGSLHRFLLFNADPHPGNYLFHEDGTVTFLDFGCVKRFTRQQEQVFVQMENAVIERDAKGLHDAVVALGTLPNPDSVSPQRLLDWYLPSCDPILEPGPYTYTREWAASEVRRQYDPFNEWKDVSRQFAIPKDLLFLGRITIGLNSVLGLLETTCDARSVGDELRMGAPPVTELGRLEAEWLGRRGAA
ncbi:MAG: AarF/ABC1/UbiB kinase family protein [Actinobacteria bacterium]|nr:AarF/ABC1/UbiB kinase family protein [Actinomycetota bacterium]